MDDEPNTLHEEDIPEKFPAGDEGSEPEIDDQPMGVPADADDVETDLPGIPESEPPASE